MVVDEGQTVNANQTTPTIVQIADLSREIYEAICGSEEQSKSDQ